MAADREWGHGHYTNQHCDVEGCAEPVMHALWERDGWFRGDDVLVRSLCETHYAPVRNKKKRKRRNAERRALKN